VSAARVTTLLAVIVALLSLVAVSPLAHGADPQRGQLLYENHCLGCHDSRAHVRDNRRARSLDEVRQWVDRWSRTLSLDWGIDDRDDVAGYLYARYYTATQ